MITVSDPFGRLPPRSFDAVYVIGDVHGRLDLLEEMLDWVSTDAQARLRAKACVISVGDLVDRGPNIADVVEVFAAGERDGIALLAVRGNHEEMVIDALDGADASVWLMNGGMTTLGSYGADDLAAFAKRIPKTHESFLRSMPLAYRADDHLVVHAGIRPGIAPEDQSATDLLWMREPFLSDDAHRDFTVVHGHTISRRPEIRPFRVGIDTGAWMSDTLTCLALDGGGRRVRQTGSFAYSV